jgi:radical SAM superfamily enzyme YgiQ (UPF0313 family)
VAILEKAGHECKFLDAQAKNISLSAAEQLTRDFRPDLVVLQGTTPSIYSDLEHAQRIKEINPAVTTVMVGAHVSAEPEDTLRNGRGFLDIVARGEYDYTLADIAGGKAFKEITGISYWDNGLVRHNSARSFIKDLDRLPFPAWHHISLYDYHDAGKLYPFITLLGGRGCEGRCSFCLFPQVMYGGHYRPRSIESVLSEVEYDLKLFPHLKEIMFEDDTFTLKNFRERLAGICEGLLRRRIKISWAANARPDFEDGELFKLMRRSGCRMLCVGFEFGSQEMLDRVHKGITLDKMHRFAFSAHKAGIRLHGCFMIGGPGETEKTALETIRFARSLALDTVQFSGVCAYPGTEFYRWCKDNRYLLPRDWRGWVDDNMEQRAIISYPQLSNYKINRLVDTGLKRFYLRPVQIWRMLFNIRFWADIKTKSYGLKSFLTYFFKR